MLEKHVVAIVGRPNVGKSALFNRLVGARSSIVHKESGVTRDRLYGLVTWGGREFTLLDTGGMDLDSTDDMVKAIRVQVEQAIDEADLLLFVVDSRAGLTRADVDIADILRKTRKPVLLVVNKVDAATVEPDTYEFYSLGFAQVMNVSAAHGLGIGDLLDTTKRLLEATGAWAQTEEEGDDDAIRVAVVGKPNVGKSSLVNALLGDERMTVSTRPGTTIDAVDTPFEWEGRRFVLVDTAGLRRPKVIGEKLEGLSVSRALSAVKRADVAILVVDGNGQLSSQERRIAGYIRRNAKASVIVANKVDLGLYGEVTRPQFRAAALYVCRPIDYSEVLFASCLTGEGVDKVLPEVVRIFGEYNKRIETSILNQVVSDATGINPPPRDVKVFYATQVEQRPPRVVFFARNAKGVSEMYKRYLDAELRKRLGFGGSPIVMEFRDRPRRQRARRSK